MRQWILPVIVTSAILGWSAALIAAPLVATHSDNRLRYAAALLYAGGSLICHQRPERSFHLAGAQLPVCARCLGLYVGAAIGAVLWIGVRRGWRSQIAGLSDPRTVRMLVIIFALPTIITVLTATLGWWDPANELRAGLALPLGGIAGLLVTAVSAGDLR